MPRDSGTQGRTGPVATLEAPPSGPLESRERGGRAVGTSSPAPACPRFSQGKLQPSRWNALDLVLYRHLCSRTHVGPLLPVPVPQRLRLAHRAPRPWGAGRTHLRSRVEAGFTMPQAFRKDTCQYSFSFAHFTKTPRCEPEAWRLSPAQEIHPGPEPQGRPLLLLLPYCSEA